MISSQSTKVTLMSSRSDWLRTYEMRLEAQGLGRAVSMHFSWLLGVQHRGRRAFYQANVSQNWRVCVCGGGGPPQVGLRGVLGPLAAVIFSPCCPLTAYAKRQLPSLFLSLCSCALSVAPRLGLTLAFDSLVLLTEMTDDRMENGRSRLAGPDDEPSPEAQNVIKGKTGDYQVAKRIRQDTRPARPARRAGSHASKDCWMAVDRTLSTTIRAEQRTPHLH